MASVTYRPIFDLSSSYIYTVHAWNGYVTLQVIIYHGWWKINLDLYPPSNEGLEVVEILWYILGKYIRKVVAIV